MSTPSFFHQQPGSPADLALGPGPGPRPGSSQNTSIPLHVSNTRYGAVLGLKEIN